MCRIQPPASFSVPFLQRRHWPYCAKLTWIQSGCPGQVLAKLIWSEASWFAKIIEPSSRQGTTDLLPVSHFQTRLHSSTDVPDNSIQNQPRSSLIVADCAKFWPNGSSPETSQYARIIRPTSGQCFPADPARMRIRSHEPIGSCLASCDHN